MIRFSEVMLWLSLGVIGVWAAYALAEPIYLHTCSKTTCQKGTGVVDASMVARDILAISNSTECPDKCAVVDYGKGQAHSMGNWLDIGCRAWGGSLCKWDRETTPQQRINEITEGRYR